MLASLAIRDVVLIDRLDLAFAPGLTVLTGETGAGKSILLDALGLAIGQRGDAGLVRHGASQASVTAVFEIPDRHEARRIAEVNVPALKRDLERYLQMRESAVQRHEAEEKALRQRVSIDIPALSPAARVVLERVRDAIDRNDLSAALAYALSNRETKLEIDGQPEVCRSTQRTSAPDDGQLAVESALQPCFACLACSAGMAVALRQAVVAVTPHSSWPLSEHWRVRFG